MTWCLWHDDGCKLGGLGTTVVYGTQELSESSRLGGGDVEPQVAIDRKGRGLDGEDPR